MCVFIGADGGASKLLLCLKRGGEESFLKTDVCVNPNAAGEERSVRVIVDSMLALCGREGVDAGRVNGIFAGIAGATELDYRAHLCAALSSAFPNAVCGADHDGENVLSAAFPGSDGVIVICGTGSSCFVRKDGETLRIGGYGIYDLEGNGYEMGRRAIAHTLKSYDGRAKRCALCEATERLAGGNCLERLNELIALPMNGTARFAQAVFAAADEGDPAAEAIIDSTARFLAEYIFAAKAHFGATFDVCIAGSVGTNAKVLNKIQQLASGTARVFALGKEPVTGATVKAEQLYYGRKHL